MLSLLCEGTADMVMKMRTIKTYSELITLPTFEERYEYLRIGGRVGEDTFGYDRYLNQAFYKSGEWLRFRNYIISRDNGCDLGCSDREIPNGLRIIIHHIEPITADDIINHSSRLLDPDNAITTIDNTHRAIHYSDNSILTLAPIERRPNDTCPWRH